jgi:hypothetical protein
LARLVRIRLGKTGEQTWRSWRENSAKLASRRLGKAGENSAKLEVRLGKVGEKTSAKLASKARQGKRVKS